MDRFDPSAHADYLITLLAVAFALERLVPSPRTRLVQSIVGSVRRLEGRAQSRLAVLRGRPRWWTELTLLGGALAVRVLAFFLWQAVAGAGHWFRPSELILPR